MADKLGKATVTAKKRPIKADAMPGKLDQSDIARLDTYIARLKSVKNPTQAQRDSLAKYTARKSSYRIRLGDTAAARRAKAGG